MLRLTRLYSMTIPKDKLKYIPTNGTYPKGFKVGSVSCQVKKNGNPDLSLIYSSYNCNAAGVFTTNKFKAAPVIIDRDNLQSKLNQNFNSIIINSGCANAVTGNGGLNDAREIINYTDKKLGNNVESISNTLTMSTGVIGQRLQMDKIKNGIDQIVTQLDSNHEHWLNCAKGIMTTDTFPKLISKSFQYNNITYNIAGLVKGAGMICPNMATLLGLIITDAPIEHQTLQNLLTNSVNKSFNCISVDGDMSTNDTILSLSNGQSGGEIITENGNLELYELFEKNYNELAIELAKLVVRDGEGATKFITINIKNAKNDLEAQKAANSISNSALVKTAMFGKDANWGRILCAIGYSNIEVNPSTTNVSFIPTDGSKELKLLVNGEPQIVDETRASEILELPDLQIDIDLGLPGDGQCQFWTCDLSHDYVTINGDYRS
ncbi:glutamate N-acetyltransferase [Pichia kluyveri]|uniref:Arginine biosynthesis bifunctional protein ArgJ, mitochondrial n=1 Tax=Pichia kluyveri TaxID=36015 RepID=A0AAV5R2F9_PICKL|nr:glutamate N-acetyltransferase [Pichia kluyveri]